MKKFKYSLIIGIIAGIIDVTPMIIQGLCWYANLSAFTFWIAMGIIIPSVNWKIKGWLKGLIIAELSALSIIIFVAKYDTKSIFPIFIMTLILGSLIGIFSEKFSKGA